MNVINGWSLIDTSTIFIKGTAHWGTYLSPKRKCHSWWYLPNKRYPYDDRLCLVKMVTCEWRTFVSPGCNYDVRDVIMMWGVFLSIIYPWYDLIFSYSVLKPRIINKQDLSFLCSCFSLHTLTYVHTHTCKYSCALFLKTLLFSGGWKSVCKHPVGDNSCTPLLLSLMT